jgi:hypothetical protein
MPEAQALPTRLWPDGQVAETRPASREDRISAGAIEHPQPKLDGIDASGEGCLIRETFQRPIASASEEKNFPPFLESADIQKGREPCSMARLH